MHRVKKRDCWEMRRRSWRGVIQGFLCRWTCWTKTRRMRRRSPWTAPAPRTRKTALRLLTQNSPSLHPTPQLPSNPPPLPSQMAGGRPSPTGLPACLPSPTWTTTTWSLVDPWGGAPPTRALPLQPTTTATTPPTATPLDHPRSAPAADTLWTRRR